MKIVYLHQYFNTLSMTGGTRSYELARRLVTMGHEVHMVTSDRSVQEIQRPPVWRLSVEAGINVHWTPVSYDNRMSVLRRACAFIQFAVRAMRKSAELRGDIVFATSTPLTIAIPAIWAARRNGVPMVFEIRDIWPDVPIAMGVINSPILKWAARKLESIAYSESEHVVALAPGMKRHVAEKGISEASITVIPNGCDNYLYAGRDAEAAALRELNAWLGNRPLIVYCGAIGHVNGVDFLARVAAEVAVLNDQIRFAVIGSGQLAGQLRETADSCGVLGRTFFILGPLPKQKTADWMCASDMAIALITGPEILWRHATQNKFFDALAARKPIANNFVGWQSEIAVENNAGLVIDSEDASLAARQLVEKLDDADWMERAAENAATLARSTFDREQQARQLDTVLVAARESYQR